MAEETKKISFGFSRLKKPSNLVKVPETKKSDVEYVDSFDGAKGKFSYKGNVRCDEPVKKELVIPLIGTKTALEVIKLRLESKKLENGKDSKEKTDNEEIKGDGEKPDLVKSGDSKNQTLPEENKDLSIDDLAAKEILNDLQNNTKTEKSSKTLVIKQSTKVSRSAEELQIDYENIPVSDFGLAMLRGMGWTPETGIGKDQKVVEVVTPKLRPKGLGLGADKVMKNKVPEDPDLTISIKSYVKFVSGTYKGNYGQVEAMDDDTGRVTVKLALGGVVSTSEILLIPVTKKDYEKNCKVINPTKYEDYRERTGSESESKDLKEVKSRSSQRERKEDKNNRHRKESYDRSYERDRVSKRRDEGNSSNRRKRYSSSDSSSLRSPERSKHKESRKSSREESRDRRHKKSKKKRKKKNRDSDYDAEDSDEKRYKSEKSSHHSRHSKSKRR